MESNRLVKILCVVCAAGCCLSSCGSTGEEKPKKLSSVSTGVTTTVTTNKKSAETITGSVTTIQTAATCTKIVLMAAIPFCKCAGGIYSYKQFK